MVGKASEAYTQRLTEIEMRDVERLARQQERSVSEFIRLLVRQHLYGSVARMTAAVEKNNRLYEHQETGGVDE